MGILVRETDSNTRLSCCIRRLQILEDSSRKQRQHFSLFPEFGTPNETLRPIFAMFYHKYLSNIRNIYFSTIKDPNQ